MSNLKFLFLFILFLASFNIKAQSSIDNFKILDSIASSEETKTNDSIYSKILPLDSLITSNKNFKYLDKKKTSKLNTIPKPRFFKDSTRTSAKDAALLGGMFPGLGQIYNRKYWKLPIVYGGIAGSIYWLASSAIKTKEYNGYLVKAAKNEPLPPNIAIYGTSQIESIRNTHRRNVQLATFVTVMVWGFTILDAAVDAHIRPFDVSDNLSMQIKPSIHQFQQENYFALSVNLNLK
ncbi:MAG TPA: DUF5683 domain-containing protein [Chitinophagales bacterium]|nr:DUF5683 domain-containing protein [Chitinophagales bacterium]HNL17469.1 DUF5683 domain-containing protein [Chitinophagales bacterium]